MPKLVFDNLVRNMMRDIRINYTVGSRYRTIREIAEHFEVSVQTAQKAVTLLIGEGLLSGKRRAGIYVLATERQYVTSGKKLLVLSNKQDFRFYHAFYEGIEKRAGESGVSTELLFNNHERPESLDFGHYLTSLDVDGVVALSYSNSALPFYHAIREGLDIVSDIIIDELPLLPAIQTDNYLHAHKAGEMLIQNGFRDFYIFGYYPEDNRRYQGFYDAVKETARSVAYIHLSEMKAMEKTDAVFHDLSPETAVFSCDYSANYILASHFVKHRIKVTPLNFLSYDAETEFFHYPGLPPIKSVAPSFTTLGESLADMLIRKWETGTFPSPLQRKI